MPGRDPGHWLHRLDAAEWLAAAATELAHCAEKLAQRAVRAGVTHARRAAGMAWNAVLSMAPDEAYGRSYMDHLKALAEDATVPSPIREAARALAGAPLESGLVQLGAGDVHLADLAAAIVAHARDRVKPTASA